MTRGWFSCHTGELGSPTKTVTYRYDDADWGDLLTEYDGNAITYDQIGNPLSDGTRSYTWRHGRQLATLTEDGTTWTNTYDADGMRVSRSNGTVAYSYIYSGSKLRQMTVGTDVLTFTYDAAGIPMSLSYNGTEYYYVTNLQGDVVGILDSAGQQVVAYSYDAWGKLLSTTGTMATTLGTQNPLCYRGYVYDTEYGYYYLQSRYYDPQIGRFLNADAFVSTGTGLLGNNMFAYCLNNPVMYTDSTGEEAVVIVVGATVISIEALLQVAVVVLAVLVIGTTCSKIGSKIKRSRIINDTDSKTDPDTSSKVDEKGRPIVEPGQQPTEKDGYRAPKGGPQKGKTPDGRMGWKDKSGNIWVPQATGSQSAHGGGHWDVQSPNGGYINVYPGGTTRGGQPPYPKLPIFS